MREISAAAFARELGVTRQSIAQAIEEGRIVSVRRDGKKYLINADKAKQEFTSSRGPRGGSFKKKPIVEQEDIEQKPKLAALRVAREMKKLQLDTLEYERRKGELVNKDEAEKRIFEIAQELRQSLQNIPARIVDDVLACKTRNEAFIIIEDAIAQTLDDFSRNLKRGI